MNSKSKNRSDEGTSYRQPPKGRCAHSAPDRIFLTSNNGSLGPLPITFITTVLSQTINQPVASITIDASGFKDPIVQIDFTGILDLTTFTALANATLNFTLFRSCRETGLQEPVATFSFYVVEQTGGVTSSHTLVFKYISPSDGCEDNCACEGCTTYTLQLDSIFNLGIGTLTFFINGTISALVVDSGGINSIGSNR